MSCSNEASELTMNSRLGALSISASMKYMKGTGEPISKSLYSDRRFACKTDAKRRTLRNHTDTPAEGRVVPAIAPPRGPSGPRGTVAARVRRGQGAGKCWPAALSPVAGHDTSMILRTACTKLLYHASIQMFSLTADFEVATNSRHQSVKCSVCPLPQGASKFVLFLPSASNAREGAAHSGQARRRAPWRRQGVEECLVDCGGRGGCFARQCASGKKPWPESLI